MLAFNLFRRELAVLFSLCLVLVLAADTVTARTATAQPPGAPGSDAQVGNPSCEADYRILDQRPDTFTGIVIIRTTYPVFGPDEITWTFTAGQRVTEVWHARITRPGPEVILEAGGNRRPADRYPSVTVRFEATWNGISNPVPDDIGFSQGICRTPPPPPSFDDCGQGRFHSEVTFEEGKWITRHLGVIVYDGLAMRDAVQAGIDALTPGRTTKEGVVVRSGGTLSGDQPIQLASHTRLEMCEPVTNQVWNRHAVEAVGARNVEVGYLATTAARPGVLLRAVTGARLGLIHASVQIDSQDHRQRSRKIEIDWVEPGGENESTTEPMVLADAVDGLQIGTVISHRSQEATVMLRNASDVSLRHVEGWHRPNSDERGPATVAITAGSDLIQVGTVVARSQYGVECAGNSTRVRVERFHVTNDSALLIRGCQDVVAATDYGFAFNTIADVLNPGGLQVGGDDTADVTFQFFHLERAYARWMPCGGENIRIAHATMVDVQMFWCADRLPEP